MLSSIAVIITSAVVSPAGMVTISVWLLEKSESFSAIKVVVTEGSSPS